MNSYTKIKGILLAVWALLSFAVTFLLIFFPSLLCLLLPEPQSSRLFTMITKRWMHTWLPMAGCPVTIRGKKHFQSNQVYIVTCNHNSLMDVPLSSPFIPGANKTIAKKSFARIPIFGLFYKMGSVLVDRKSDESRKESYQKMKQVLALGIHMCIYPEGTRNKTKDPLAPFHSGAFRLACETNTPIIPAVILHTRKVLPAGKGFYFSPHPVAIHFLAPILIQTHDTPETLLEKTRQAMLVHLAAQASD